MSHQVRLSRNWWVVDVGTIIAKFKIKHDAVEYATAQARQIAGVVYVFGEDGRVSERIQT